MFLYTLRLDDMCWYVGTTALDLQVRLREHLCGRGSEWTRQHAPVAFSKKYPPIRLEEPDALCRLEEDKRVKQLMLEYGIDRVRGGSYARILLSRSDVMTLSKELYHAQNACLRCGRRGHWANVCRAVNDIVGNTITAMAAERKRPHSAVYGHDDGSSEEGEEEEDGGGTSEEEDGSLEGEDDTWHWKTQCYARRRLLP